LAAQCALDNPLFCSTSGRDDTYTQNMAPDRKDMKDPVRRPLRIEGLADSVRKFELPKTPFARLGLTHGVCAGGDTLVTIALAKTLFFVSPTEARSKVLLYLLLTLAPFAVVSPFIGPLVDHFSGNKRWVIFATAAARSLLCFVLAGDVKGALLFPEAFVLLVVSKSYAVARSSLVPAVVPNPDELVQANSRLALIGGVSGFSAALPGVIAGHFGAPWALRLASIVFGVAAYFSMRIVVVKPDAKVRADVDADTRAKTTGDDTKTDANSAFDVVSHATETGSPTVKSEAVKKRDLERRRRIELRLATLAMSVLRGLVGLVTFLVAFSFKREHYADAWLGLMGGAGVLGGLLGSIIAPRARRAIDESRILLSCLILTTVVCALGILLSDPIPSALVVFAVAFGAATARLAFDALMQRDSDKQSYGAAFAGLETRFQLSWVLGALIPVATSCGRAVGFGVMGAISAGAVAMLVGGEQSLKRIDAALDAGSSVWRKPLRVTEEEWRTGEEFSGP
jgi:Na+/melibiose symporter-like transporter